MASAFEFNQVPKGNVGRQLAAFVGSRLNAKGKSSDSLSAKDRAGLMDKQHAQNIEHAVVQHVIGERTANAEHNRSQVAANAAHERTKSEATHYIDHFERLGSTGQFSNLNVGAKGVSGSFKTPAKDTSSEAPSTPNTGSSGSVNLEG